MWTPEKGEMNGLLYAAFAKELLWNILEYPQQANAAIEQPIHFSLSGVHTEPNSQKQTDEST